MLAVNEIFRSVQGEGVWAGTPMTFIRFAGCNLRCSWCDQPDTIVQGFVDRDGKLWDLRYTKMEVDDIMKQVHKDVEHVCLTGGEPTTHKLDELVDQLEKFHKFSHIETNGTHHPKWLDRIDHITVSPKREALALPSVVRIAGELKFIVDQAFTMDEVSPYIKHGYKNRMYLQPANFQDTADNSMTRKALQLVLDNPKFKLSLQLHKVLGVR